jgi:DtxR family manganese transport transcriptional regulator
MPARVKSESGGRRSAGRQAPQARHLVSKAVHAESFRRAREARRRAQVEDYVELIDDLIRDGGEARQVDLAARLGVAQPTVARMLKRLIDDGLAISQPYRGVFLTEAGTALATATRRRHRLVQDFLLALGVPEAVALRDAEGIEHHVSDETVEVFKAFLEARSGR